MIKIKEYKIQKHGARGVSLTIPRVWLEDLDLGYGDSIEVFRDLDNHLILRPKVKTTPPKDQAERLREMMTCEEENAS